MAIKFFNDVAVDSNVLYVDTVNDHVGIGTTTPDAKLDVAGRAIIGTGNTIGTVDASIIGSNNNATTDTIIDSSTSAVIGDANSGRYGNTVISDRTLRIGRADNIGSTSINTTGILNFNDSVEANSAFSNVGGIVGYFPPPTTTNDYYFISAFSENVGSSVFQAGASPTASRFNMSTSPTLNGVGQKFDANTTNGGAMYITASNNSPTASSRGIFTFDARHQNQNYTVPDGHSLFEVTSGYGQTKFIIKQVNGSSNVGIGTTSPGEKLAVSGGNIEIADNTGGRKIGFDVSDSISFNSTTIAQYGMSNAGNSEAGGITYSGYFGQKFFTNGAQRMVIKRYGNVGIGTTSPSNKLHVHDSSAAYKGITLSGNAAPSIVFDSTNSVVDWKIGNSGTNANNFAISTSATSANESVVVTSDGNVGIGTTNPTGNLHVNSTAATASYFQGLNSTLRILNNTSNDNWLQSGTSTATSQAKLYVSGMNGSNITTTFDIPNGRVGIGTTVPSQTLDVGGNARVSGILYTNASVGSSVGIIGKAIPNGWASRYDSNNANYSGVYFDGNNQCIILGRNSGGTIVNYIHASGSSYFNGGNVGIGTTSPALKLEVEGGDGLLQLSTISSTGNPYMSFNQAGSRRSFIQHADSGDYLKLASEYGGISFFTGTGGTETQKMTILSGGNVGIGTTNPSYQLQLSLNSAAKPTSSAWTVVSDERVKTNIRSYKTGLQELLQVEPKLFDYNGKAGFDSSVKDNIGIIAQEIKDIMPETVKKYKAKLNESDVEETELYNFDGHAITFALINAVKELNTKIKELQNEIQTLKQNG